MDIIIIGSGWYGLHTLKYLSNKYKNINIILLEKNGDIFENSSNYNQNRLHLGYHYPRSYKTRNLCKYGYKKFIKEYRDVIDFIDKNYYLISDDSIIDYETFIKIYSNDNDYDHTIIKNEKFKNINENIINTKEKIINSEKVKEYFIKNIDMSKIKFNYKVGKIEKNNNKIIINGDLVCDILIDCSYNQMNLSKKEYIYELTISLIYTKIKNINFESLTIMDGDFFSLFPRNINKDKYTLTHVKYTPLIKSHNINDILNYKITEEEINNIKKNMENEVKIYYSEFRDNFEYVDYFTSYKCKLISNNDTRECNIEEYNNIITVNCGKITGIFEFEDYLDKYLTIYFEK
jgi:hypothetical protein